MVVYLKLSRQWPFDDCAHFECGWSAYERTWLDSIANDQKCVDTYLAFQPSALSLADVQSKVRPYSCCEYLLCILCVCIWIMSVRMQKKTTIIIQTLKIAPHIYYYIFHTSKTDCLCCEQNINNAQIKLECFKFAYKRTTL